MCRFTKRYTYPYNYTYTQTVVIQKMVTSDPFQRPSAKFILRSTFFEDLRNAVKKKPLYVPEM